MHRAAPAHSERGMELSPTALALIGLLLAVWTAGAAWMVVRFAGKAARADQARHTARRLTRMIDEAPAIPMLVRVDGRVEAPDRLAAWLGLSASPRFLTELSVDTAGEGAREGLSREQLANLTDHIGRAQKTAAPFRIALTLPGSQRSLALKGALADPQISPGGAVLVWVFDFSDSESELTRLRDDSHRAKADFAALIGLIEAAPMPMWFRGVDGKIRLVNDAFVRAVGGRDAAGVVADQVELVERVDGASAADIALQAAERGRPVERIVTATIGGERRTLRVSDLPLGDDGVAGYAIDIEDMEAQARQFRAFRDAQRSMLDQLSNGVAQFDAAMKLKFANQPFRRIFAMTDGKAVQDIPFDRLLTQAREDRRLPEVRDFPAWRAERAAWFAADTTQEEAWPLPDGTHLRIVAQPMPDGGLVMIVEDRTEQLALSATRDTLLRTRTATLDSLFEALAVFAPDGRMQLWNRRFAGVWGLRSEQLDENPMAKNLLSAIAPKLDNPKQAKGIEQIIRAATLDRKQQAGRVALKDGRTLEIAGVPLPDGNGLLTILDITDSQKAEDALRERNIALEQADGVKTRFLANMSYEFRTPLTSIGGFAELLHSGAAGELSDAGKEYADAILTSVERLTAQVEDVLNLSQSEAGLLPLSKRRIELMPFVTAIVRSRAEAVAEAGIALDLRGNSTGFRVEADERQLARAVEHVLDNAIAATPDGGKVLMMVDRAGKMARIVVSDNGPGMTKAELGRALDGMRHGDSSGMQRRQGLGLPLARQLVEGHGGTLSIESEPGEGTTVVILLP